MALSTLARDFINRYQGGFPFAAARPFADAADRLGSSEAALIDQLRGLLDDGYLSRFGPIYDASRLGGGQTLAALSAPAVRFDAVAEQVNALPAVAHNYRREHLLNMWFVIASATAEGIGEALQTIQQDTGLRVYDFPKEHEFYLGLWLRLDASGGVDTVPAPVIPPTAGSGHRLDAIDRQIIAATQAGLPLQPQPLVELGRRTALSPGLLAERLQAMLDSGAIRRIGAIPNHYRLGLRGNGMTVWDVPDERAIALGERIGALDFVSHSYLRPRYPGIWPYNLFAMVHGHDREAVLNKSDRLAAILQPYCRAHDVLFSSAVLKKTGLRVAA